jgi:hypothetical protein
LYNTSDISVSLAGWSLTDDEDEPDKWVFPAVAIGPHGYLIVFCSGKDRKPTTPGLRLHTSFRLSPDGEFIGLYNAEVPRSLVSSFDPYPNQRNDYSWGYDPTDQLKYFQFPTPGAANGASSITGVVGDTKFSHDRGFYSAPFSLSITCATPGVTIRYTTNGTPPTVSSGFIYSSPISVPGTKVVRAAAYKTGLLSSDVDSQTYLFVDDIVQQPNEVAPGPGWPTQKKSNGGGQNYDYGMDPDIVNNATFSTTIKEDLKAIPTFSLVMDIATHQSWGSSRAGSLVRTRRKEGSPRRWSPGSESGLDQWRSEPGLDTLPEQRVPAPRVSFCLVSSPELTPSMFRSDPRVRRGGRYRPPSRFEGDAETSASESHS